MADRRQIESMVKKKEQEIQELEAQIKEARIYVQALQDVLKRFPRDSDGVVSPDATLRPGSLVGRARETILRRAKPLHVEQILADLGKEPTRKNKIALGGSLSAYVRKGIIFTRSAPNTFGLVELTKRTGSGPEPPMDFGGVPAPQQDDEEIPF